MPDLLDPGSTRASWQSLPSRWGKSLRTAGHSRGQDTVCRGGVVQASHMSEEGEATTVDGVPNGFKTCPLGDVVIPNKVEPAYS